MPAPPPKAIHGIVDYLKQVVAEQQPWTSRYLSDRPDVPRPGIFLPDVPMNTSPELARPATRIIDQTPGLKQRLSRITSGPDGTASEDLRDSGIAADRYGDTNLLGTYDPKSHDISMNPARTPPEQLRTLIHELTHAAGSLSDREDGPAYTSGPVWDKLLSAEELLARKKRIHGR